MSQDPIDSYLGQGGRGEYVMDDPAYRLRSSRGDRLQKAVPSLREAIVKALALKGYLSIGRQVQREGIGLPRAAKASNNTITRWTWKDECPIGNADEFYASAGALLPELKELYSSGKGLALIGVSLAFTGEVHEEPNPGSGYPLIGDDNGFIVVTIFETPLPRVGGDPFLQSTLLRVELQK